MHELIRLIQRIFQPMSKKEDMLPLIRGFKADKQQRDALRLVLMDELIAVMDKIRQAIAEMYDVAVDDIEIVKEINDLDKAVGSTFIVYRNMNVALNLTSQNLALDPPYFWALVVKYKTPEKIGQKPTNVPTYGDEDKPKGNEIKEGGTINDLSALSHVVEDSFTKWILDNRRIVERMGEG